MRWDAGRATIKHWWDHGLDLIYPPRCASCEGECESAGERLCGECRRQFDDRQPACAVCGRTLAAFQEANSATACAHCKADRPRFELTVRLGQYEGLLRAAILRLKRMNDPSLGMALANLLVDRRSDPLAAIRAEVVVPMPMHWTRRIRRGVNSPDLLARIIGERLQLPVAPHLLRMQRRVRPQTGLTRAGRWENVRGAFRVPLHPDLAGARVLLIDDVMTTGATAGEATGTLLRAGAAEVAIAVLARAEGLG
jgi:ComF family protein